MRPIQNSCTAKPSDIFDTSFGPFIQTAQPHASQAQSVSRVHKLLLNLNDTVATSNPRPALALRRRSRPLLQQPHQLPHRIRNYKLRVALNENIQLRVLARLRILASRVERPLRRDGRPGRFEDFGHVRSVRDGPPCFFYSAQRG